ncbi:hypothetical protein D3C85_1906610 [compost metagenome]
MDAANEMSTGQTIAMDPFEYAIAHVHARKCMKRFERADIEYLADEVVAFGSFCPGTFQRTVTVTL